MSVPRTPILVLGIALVLLAGCAATPPAGPSTDAQGMSPTAAPTPGPPSSPASPPYRITVRPLGPMEPGVLAAFQTAADRWERVMTAAVAPVSPPASFNGCLGVGPTGTIEGMVIDIQVTPIDGPNGILGSAGPCRAAADRLPRAGLMRFDSADVAGLMLDGRFVQVVEHEMAHVLGVGTVWSSMSLISGSGTSDPRFTGSNAVTEWRALGGTGDVPVEATGGSGTAEAHWRESVFVSELMTGWLNWGTNPISRLTIASLADLGYQVDLSQADGYTLPSGLLGAALRGPMGAVDDGDMILVEPSPLP